PGHRPRPVHRVARPPDRRPGRGPAAPRRRPPRPVLPGTEPGLRPGARAGLRGRDQSHEHEGAGPAPAAGPRARGPAGGLMLESLRFRAAHAVRLAAALPAYRAFRAALDRPAEAQARRLRAILAAGADSAYGRRHDFARLRGVTDYQAAVPV